MFKFCYSTPFAVAVFCIFRAYLYHKQNKFAIATRDITIGSLSITFTWLIASTQLIWWINRRHAYKCKCLEKSSNVMHFPTTIPAHVMSSFAYRNHRVDWFQSSLTHACFMFAWSYDTRYLVPSIVSSDSLSPPRWWHGSANLATKSGCKLLKWARELACLPKLISEDLFGCACGHLLDLAPYHVWLKVSFGSD